MKRVIEKIICDFCGVEITKDEGVSFVPSNSCEGTEIRYRGLYLILNENIDFCGLECFYDWLKHRFGDNENEESKI